MTKPPTTRVNLDKAIERLFGSYEHGTEVRSLMANAIIGQLLPDGVVKGGTSLKLRYGNLCTRVTTDLDMACRADIPSFVAELAKRLAVGWNGFTGTVVARTPAAPKDVPAEYVMKPYAVKLSYNGRSWCTVDLELGFNEIGDADQADYGISEDVKAIFAALCLPPPDPIPLMRLEYQVAQKLHGATEPNSQRAHDLIDLQLMLAKSEVDLHATNAICRRLFAYRNMQSWPAVVVKGTDWDSIYDEGKGHTPVLPTVDEAIALANDLIRRISAAQ